MLKEALQWLADHTGARFVEIDGADAESQLLVLAPDASIESLEKYQSAPNRIKAKPSFESLESFCAYVNVHKVDGTTVYLDVRSGNFRAVIDHHGVDTPRWADHSASFSPRKSIEWEAWTSLCNKGQISQTVLAYFIEERLNDIIEPESNKVYQAALDFQLTERHAVRSIQDLDTGSVDFAFVKNDMTTKVQFPHRIKIEVPIYEHRPKKQFELRVRYRQSEGQLSFTVSFVKRVEEIVHNELADIGMEIENNTENLPVYKGSPGNGR